MTVIVFLPSSNHFENELPDEQADVDEAQLTCVIEKTLLTSQRTFIVFIDYSKAFDMVSHI